MSVYQQFAEDLDNVAYQRVHDFTESGEYAHGDVEAMIGVLVDNPKQIRMTLFLFYSLGYNAGMQDRLSNG